MTFYASGTHIKTDEWVEGFFSVSNGGIFTVSRDWDVNDI
jgi:hypothetical protein